MPKQVDKITEILGELLNIKGNYAEEKYIGKFCMVCGFPFDKKYREDKLKQARQALYDEILKALPAEILNIRCKNCMNTTKQAIKQLMLGKD